MAYFVTLNPSGKQFINEDECSILDAATQANIHLPHSCRDGSCGTCKSKLLKGEVKQPGSLGGVSDKELAEGYILTCVAQPRSDLEIEASYYTELDGIEPAIFPCKVASIDFPAEDVAMLKLRLPPGSNMKYIPGQYIDLMWKGLRRSYSIANSAHQEHSIELHIRHVPGGVFSNYLFDELKLETLLRLHGPHGTFFVRDSDAPIIFLAGGTGFAPVKAMVEQLLEDNSNRQIYIYWGVRTIDALYTKVADLWQENNDNIKFVPVLSGSSDNWQGRHGFVHRAVIEDIEDLSIFEVYACGSLDMIAVAKGDFLKQGLLEKNFFADAFTPSK